MSNKTTPAIERGSSALNKHPLFGCTCCTWPDQYDDEHPDGCPREDGYTDHDYGDTCWRSQSWSAILTADVLTAALDDPEFANHIRDWRLTPCEHSRPLRYGPDLSGSAGRREQACSPCLRDRLRAYLLGGAS